MTTLTSRHGELTFGPGLPVVLINGQVHPLSKKPQMVADLQQGNVDAIVALARAGQAAGMDIADILIQHPALDEVALLPRLAVAVHEATGSPIALDSRHPAALEAALAALHPYKALINSVTAERASLETLLPIAARHHAAIIGMPIGDRHGMPKDVEGRMDEARVILDAAARHGIPQDDVVMDAICLAAAVEPGSMLVTLETLRRFHEELGVATVLGVGNAGHGMPKRLQIELAYLLAAIPWGLDAAIIDPRMPLLIEETRAADFLSARDPYGLRYIKHYRTTKS